MIYENDRLNKISFPLGGIGTGNIGLCGNGSLCDWEIFNKPNKGSLNGYSHIAVKVTDSNGNSSVKVLNGDVTENLTGVYMKTCYRGFGFGVNKETMCGFPHFEKCVFNGQFPIANIEFKDSAFPGSVQLSAFNPFIPLDDKNSSIPAAFFEVEYTNNQRDTVEFSVAFSVRNPFSASQNVSMTSENGHFISLRNAEADKADTSYGDLTVATSCEKTYLQENWYRGGWQDSVVSFWNEFSRTNELKKRSYEAIGKNDMASVVGVTEIKPGETKKIRFVLSWNIPNNYCYWNELKDENGKDVTWKNYYASLFKNSIESAEYSLKNWEMLYEKTEQFKNVLYRTSVDECIVDAAAANISILKSPTVLRLENGEFYGWEGVCEQDGSCEGTCSHVWNYAYALCFLFPQLERSIRELEFKYNTYPTGEMDFRLKLPLGREKNKFRACVDGQMGSVIKTYREWKISGDNDWLRENWESITKIIEYAWSPDNVDRWDSDKRGILTGRQHHTLDMELFGPSSWLQGFYMGALKCGAEMAQALGYTDKAREYSELFDKGYRWTAENLFNGKYFIQSVDLKDKSITDSFDCSDTYWNDEANEIKYQIADGCEIDQLCAQWHANICGIGDLFDREQVKTAVLNIYKNNFRKSMRGFVNPWRIFALNDDGGSVICDYPKEVYKPAIPIPYCEETMSGFEYELAGLLMSTGYVKEGTEVVRAVRNRYNGANRNPWNEIECGSNYARSMASFALIPIMSGFSYDMPNKKIGFNPIENTENFRCIWSLDEGWGEFESNNGCVKLTIIDGSLTLREIILPFLHGEVSVKCDGKNVDAVIDSGSIKFNEQTAVHEFMIQ